MTQGEQTIQTAWRLTFTCPDNKVSFAKRWLSASGLTAVHEGSEEYEVEDSDEKTIRYAASGLVRKGATNIRVIEVEAR